jgi:hypothetical protein
MDNNNLNPNANFQTSFIPKKPLAQERVTPPRHTSIFSFLATLVFFGSLASAAAVYFYQANLTKTNTQKSAEIIAAQNAFQPTLIKTLERLDQRITDAKTLLAKHIVVSPIFDALQVNTLKSVQFTKFSYTTPVDPSAPITVHMSGRARDYASIALQSDQLATNKNIHNSIFSNLALDPVTGTVTFDLLFTVDADLVRDTDHLDELTPQTGTTVLPDATTTGPAGTTTGQATATAPGTQPNPSTNPSTKPTTGTSGLTQ